MLSPGVGPEANLAARGYFDAKNLEISLGVLVTGLVHTLRTRG